LTTAFDLLPIPTVFATISEMREGLLVLARASGSACASRVEFFRRVSGLARQCGEGDLAAAAACAYVYDSVRALVLGREAYEAGLGILRAFRDDGSLLRVTRSEAALVAADILLEFGQLEDALREARKAVQLTRLDEVVARAFRVAGDVETARGMYQNAARHYERATQVHGGLEGAITKGATSAWRWALAKLRGGYVSIALSAAGQLVSHSGVVGDDQSRDQAMLALELDHRMGRRRALDMVLRIRGALSSLEEKWSDCCRLSLAIAEALIELGKHADCWEHIEFVRTFAARYGNAVAGADVHLLEARIRWREGDLMGVLAAVRKVRHLLRRERPGAKIGYTEVLRAKVCFVNGRIHRAISLAKHANDTCSRAGATTEAFEAIGVIAAAGIRFDKPEAATNLLEQAMRAKLLQAEVRGLIAIGVALSSAYYAAGRPDDAERARSKVKQLLGHIGLPSERALVTLMESESHLMCGDQDAALEVAKLGVLRAKEAGHKGLEALTHYQLIRSLAGAGDYAMARECLAGAKATYGFAQRIMWQEIEQCLDGKGLSHQKIGQIGGLLF